MCALTHSKFDHSRHQRITLLFIIRILNSKYLNTDDDEGERGSKHTHIYTGETPSAFFKQHQERERENNLHKALSNRGKEQKKWIFRQNLVELVKEEKKMRQREQEEERYHSCLCVFD